MSGREDVFQQAINQGHSAAWDQRWDQAVAFYRQALEEFPDHPLALTSLGLALYELQEYEDALKCYSRAAFITPNDPLPMEKVAQLSEHIGDVDLASKAALHAADLYLKKSDVEKAIENWLRVTRLKPGNIVAHSKLALTYERLARRQRAVVEYLAVASLMQAAGEVEKAVQAVNHALIILPNSIEANQALAMLRESKPLPRPIPSRPAAGSGFTLTPYQLDVSGAPDQPANLDPINAASHDAISILAGMLFEPMIDSQGNGGQTGRRDLQAIVRGTKDSLASQHADQSKIMLHISQAVDFYTHAAEEQSAVEFERAVEAGLEHVAVYYLIGFLRSKGDQLDSALQSLQKTIYHDPYRLASRLLLGQVHRKMGRLDKAATEYLEALRLADTQVVPPEHADDLRQLYDPLIEAESHKTDWRAKEQLCVNITNLLLRPDWVDQLVRARQELPVDQPESLLMPLGEMLTMALSNRVIELISVVRQLERAGQIHSAVEEAYYAMQFAPSYLPLHTYIGELLLQQGRLPDAVGKFSMIAQVYKVRGEPARAIDLLRRVVQLAPMDLDVRRQLTDLLIAHKRSEEAVQEYLGMAGIYYSLADLAMARKTFAEALRMAHQSNADRSVRVSILYQMADIDLQSLDWRQALRVYEQIRSLHPDDDRARFNLIELNFRLGQDTQALTEVNDYLSYLASRGQRDKIVTFLEKLVGEFPKQASIRRNLAEVYRHLGRIEDAIVQLDALGELLLDSGNHSAAIEVIESLITLNPPNKEEYTQLLSKIRGG